MTRKEFTAQKALGLVPKETVLKHCTRCQTSTPHYFNLNNYSSTANNIFHCFICSKISYELKYKYETSTTRINWKETINKPPQND
jgi:hypothetical protein